MAKDPATLWYWNDWHSGTILLSRFLKGCYMDLLHAHFNHGRLSLEDIKTCLGPDFGSAWPALQKKFALDDQGLYFNERMEQEREKRKKHSAHQSKNAKKRWERCDGNANAYAKTMPLETENENRTKEVSTEFLGVVIYDAEKEISENQKEFERLCMATGKGHKQARDSLRKYHLWLTEKEQYPKGKKAVYAGFEKWLLNEKTVKQDPVQSSGPPLKKLN